MLCRNRAADVDAELNAILDEEGLEYTEQNVFQQRRRAAKRVYEQMNDNEKHEIDALVDEHAASGNTDEVRRR